MDRSYSRYGRSAVALLGVMIRNARLERRMTVADVAERAGLSRGLVHRMERGAAGCSIGAVFEVAAIVGVRLFDADSALLTERLANARETMALLPRSARRATGTVNDDF